MPDDFAGDVRIDQLSGLASHQGPTAPDGAQRSTISSRFDLIGAVSSHDHSSISEFDEGSHRRINLFHRIGKPRQSVRRRQVIRYAGFCPSGYRQSEIDPALSHQPDTRRSLAAAKEYKT